MNIADLTRKYDFDLYYWFYQLNNHSNSWHQFFYFFARYGIVFFFLSFVYLVLKKKIRAFLCILLAMGVAGTIDFIVFIFWQRPRPFVSHSNLVASFPGMSGDLGSFPSSHTYIAFAIATSVFLYGHKRLGAVLFVLALFVAAGRIGVGLHYPSDVIGGTILGMLSGVLVYHLVKNWERAH